MEQLINFLPMIVLLIAWVLLLIIPQKKRNDQVRSLLASLEVNDEVITHSGIIGKIIRIEDNIIVLESGPDRVRFRMTKDSVAVNSTKDRIKEAQKESTKKK